MTLWAVLPVKRLEKGKSRLRPCLEVKSFYAQLDSIFSTFEKLVVLKLIKFWLSVQTKNTESRQENGQIGLRSMKKAV